MNAAQEQSADSEAEKDAVSSRRALGRNIRAPWRLDFCDVFLRCVGFTYSAARSGIGDIFGHQLDESGAGHNITIVTVDVRLALCSR